MGAVYVAEQREPVRRKVALKVIKWGMDTKDVLARFEVEHHAFAIMNHPNIARVYDASATPEGRPYFVMEHVPGIPLKSRRLWLGSGPPTPERSTAACGGTSTGSS